MQDYKNQSVSNRTAIIGIIIIIIVALLSDNLWNI